GDVIGRKSGRLGSVRRSRKGIRREAKRDQNASVFHESDLLRLCNGEGPAESRKPRPRRKSSQTASMMIVMAVIIVITFHGSSCGSGEFQDMHPGTCPVCKVDVPAIVEFRVVGLNRVHRVIVPARVGKGAARAGRRSAGRSATR